MRTKAEVRKRLRQRGGRKGGKMWRKGWEEGEEFKQSLILTSISECLIIFVTWTKFIICSDISMEWSYFLPWSIPVAECPCLLLLFYEIVYYVQQGTVGQLSDVGTAFIFLIFLCSLYNHPFDVSLFNYSLSIKHIGCFQILNITNKPVILGLKVP